MQTLTAQKESTAVWCETEGRDKRGVEGMVCWEAGVGVALLLLLLLLLCLLLPLLLLLCLLLPLLSLLPANL